MVRQLLSPLELLKRQEADKREVKRFNQRRFNKTRTGQLGFVFSGFQKARNQQISFARSIRGRGRPKGSVDPRYKKFGGVYGYRKLLTAQLREDRLRQIKESSLTPQQQFILNQAQERQRRQRISPENQVIPDTDGKFDFRNIQKEI